MSDKLGVKCIVTVNGRPYHFAPDTTENGQLISVEVEHRDNEASRIGVSAWDGLHDQHFIEYDAIPNPRCNEAIPIDCVAGWEDEGLVRLFGGLLTAKQAEYQLSQTRFVGLHEAFKLRKRAKVMTYKELTVAQLLKKLAAEEGIDLKIDKTAAGDEALNIPASVYYQMGVPNWEMMLHYIRSFGYITNTIRQNEMILRVDKDGTQEIVIERGDGQMVNFQTRQEQKRHDRSPKQKRHHYEPKPGKFGHKYENTDCGKGKGVLILPPAIAKKAKQRRRDFTKFSVRGMTRRLEKEADEITLSFRFRPEMRNEEIIVLKGFSAQIDGPWHTASVVHRLGTGTARTDAACWRPA